MVDDMRCMYALGLIWFTSFILPGGHCDPWIDMKLYATPSLCKTGLQQGYDRLPVNACVHHDWSVSHMPWEFCLTIFYKKPPLQIEWKEVWGCKVCEGNYCQLNQPAVCFCVLAEDNFKCHLHGDFSSVAYSETIWRAELAYKYGKHSGYHYIYSQEIKIPPIYFLKWANFTIDGVRVSLVKCSEKFSTLGTRTFRFCAMGLVNPFVSMTFGILEVPETENSICISREVTVTENKHMLVHLNYSEHYDECNIQKSYFCDLFFADCSTKVENPVSLSVDGMSLLSTPECEMKLLVGIKHVINFCRDELKEALLQVMKDNIWTNSTQHCIQVDVIVDAASIVSYIFQYEDLCKRYKVYKCFFSGFVPTVPPPVTEAPNTTCVDCEKEITTPCYYCDEEIEEVPPYLTPVIIAIALLLIIGSIAWVIHISRKCFWKKGLVHQPEIPNRSEAKISEKISQITGYESESSGVDYDSDTDMNAEDFRMNAFDKLTEFPGTTEKGPSTAFIS